MSNTLRHDYPRCPRCGGPVAGAMMTSGAITSDGLKPFAEQLTSEGLYYHPDAVSVYCVSASCNFDKLLREIPTPVPQLETPSSVGK